MRTITVNRYVTPLREGGSMPAIVEGDDLGTYVLKFRGAGQGVRALLAEMIAGGIARALGLPARYVSGYLHSTADGKPHDAAHAWAEIHVGALGWVGFDAANACCPDDRYVRLGSGYDAEDAAPVRGMAFGFGTESLAVRVHVEEVQQ